MRHANDITPKHLPSMGQSAGHFLVADHSDLHSFRRFSLECDPSESHPGT